MGVVANAHQFLLALLDGGVVAIQTSVEDRAEFLAASLQLHLVYLHTA
jgi:hypothetical protein